MFFKSSCACNRKGEEPKLVLGYTTSNLQSQEVGGIRVEEEEDLCNMEDECNLNREVGHKIKSNGKIHPFSQFYHSKHENLPLLTHPKIKKN